MKEITRTNSGGNTKIWRGDEAGNLEIETVANQDRVQATIDTNREAAGNSVTFGQEFRKVASIPPDLINQWIEEDPVYDPYVTDYDTWINAIKRRLNDGDYRYCRPLPDYYQLKVEKD